MSAHPDPTEPLPRAPAGPPRPSGSRRIAATRLWSAGFATAVVAALVALVGVLVVRALLRIDLYAERAAGAFGDSSTGVLCLGAALAALAATGLAHLLLLSTPRPLAYLRWIIGLLTAAAVVLPFTYSSGLAVAASQAIINLVIGIAIGSLVSGAAATALRTSTMAGRPYDVE